MWWSLKRKKIQGSTFSIGVDLERLRGLEVARKEEVESVAR